MRVKLKIELLGYQLENQSRMVVGFHFLSLPVIHSEGRTFLSQKAGDCKEKKTLNAPKCVAAVQTRSKIVEAGL